MAKLSNYRVYIVVPGDYRAGRTLDIKATSDVKAWEKAVAACKFQVLRGQEEVDSVQRGEVSQQINWVKVIKPYIDKVEHD
jgi:hypothetical protein